MAESTFNPAHAAGFWDWLFASAARGHGAVVTNIGVRLVIAGMWHERVARNQAREKLHELRCRQHAPAVVKGVCLPLPDPVTECAIGRRVKERPDDPEPFDDWLYRCRDSGQGATLSAEGLAKLVGWVKGERIERERTEDEARHCSAAPVTAAEPAGTTIADSASDFFDP